MVSVNDIIGNYCMLEELASGGFGRVYRGKHTILTNRTVAIKLLHSTRLNSQMERDSFIQEALLLEKLKHPYILPIIDVGIHEGIPYLVTEYAPNGSLRNRLKHQTLLSMEEAMTILLQIGQALQYAHEQNIVHRDLKPDNVLFNVRNEVLLADFGIAVASEQTKHIDNSGTPTYMAPEQFDGIISKKSDQYALGCIAYELLTGQKPFQLPANANRMAWGYQHRTKQPVAPSMLNPQIPIYIEQAILKAMAKEHNERHADVAAFIAALCMPLKSKKQWLNEGNDYRRTKRYEEALTAYDRAIKLDHTDPHAYNLKGITLCGIKRYEEALAAFDRAIQLDPNLAFSYYNKGNTLARLGRTKEAQLAYEKAKQLGYKG